MSIKVGDRVVYNGHKNTVPFGTKGVVIKLNGPTVLVEWDGWKGGRGPHNGNLYVYKDRLKPLSENGLYIVVVEIDGKLAPAATPKTFVMKEQAEDAARDMAKRHGGKFFVFKATYEATNIITERSL